MFKSFTLLFLVVTGIPKLHASTYVGNGGSPLDSDLRQIRSDITAIADDIQNFPMDCYYLNEIKFCRILRSLHANQIAFLYKNWTAINGQMQSLTRDESIKVQWTKGTIAIGGNERTFDAIANTTTRTITIDERQFSRMNDSEKTLLLAHEFLHFAQIDGRALVDSSPIGPFKEEEGGRFLIDSYASYYAARAQLLTKEREQTFVTSKKTDSLFFSLDAGYSNAKNHGGSGDILNAPRQRFSFSINWFPKLSSNFGLSLGYVKANEIASNGDIYCRMCDGPTRVEFSVPFAGVVHRFHPFENSGPWKDSLQIQSFIRLGQARSTYSLEPVPFEKKYDVSIYSAFGVKAYLPLFNGFWFTGGATASSIPYKIGALKSRSGYQASSEWGLAYSVDL